VCSDELPAYHIGKLTFFTKTRLLLPDKMPCHLEFRWAQLDLNFGGCCIDVDDLHIYSKIYLSISQRFDSLYLSFRPESFRYIE